MKLRYELKDTYHPYARGARSTSLDRAMKQYDEAIGDPGRWQVWDRLEKRYVTGPEAVKHD